MMNDGYEPWLIQLRAKITQQLKLSVYSVSDEADVGVVFEVMNNRGTITLVESGTEIYVKKALGDDMARGEC